MLTKMSLFFHLLVMTLIPSGPDCYSASSFQVLPPAIIDVFDSLGDDNNHFLSEQEWDYFRIMFNLEEEHYNLMDKRVVFLTGSLGKSISSKRVFFNAERHRYYAGEAPLPKVLYLFDDISAKDIGVDAVIVYYSKAIPSRKQVIKVIKSHVKNND